MHDADATFLTAGPDFIPRREFLNNTTRPPAAFALLAISATNLVRLSSFPTDVVAALRRVFEHRQLLRGLREDTHLNLCEFSLESKPWSSTKNIASEKLFVDILTVIFHHGFTFLSTIDYGREHDDRVSVAFTKPTSPPTSASFQRHSNPVLFALSFPSTTVLRVINPPLSSTPAILQGVRASWPRGVVSEKKVANGCYEFKLKGYKWFQEDTFATDSLRHILSLLNSLDSHYYTLLTSLSISGSRSRSKDLWIFVGPLSDNSPPASPNGSNVELMRTVSPMSTPTSPPPDPNHARTTSASSAAQQAPQTSHPRAQTESQAPNPENLPASAQSLLRKKNSKNSKPGDRIMSQQQPPHQFPTEIQSQSSFGSVDMTGVGSASAQPGPHYANGGDMPTAPVALRSNNNGAQSHLRHVHQASVTPDSLSTTPAFMYRADEHGRMRTVQRKMAPTLPPVTPPSAYPGTVSHDTRRRSSDAYKRNASDDSVSPTPTGTTESAHDRTPPLLAPSAFHDFRDSAFSSSTAQSFEIPIAWTGAASGGEVGKRISRDESRLDATQDHLIPSDGNRHHHGQRTSYDLSGSLQLMPEGRHGKHTSAQTQSPSPTRTAFPERKEVVVRIASPTLSDQGGAAGRKSEAASLGIMSGPTLAPRRRVSSERDKDSRSTPTSPMSGSGWVLVNVEGGGTPPASESGGPRLEEHISPTKIRTRSTDGMRTMSPVPEQVSSMSPLAKAVVAADALSPSSLPRASPIKRLLGRKSRKASLAAAAKADRHEVLEALPKNSRVSIN